MTWMTTFVQEMLLLELNKQFWTLLVLGLVWLIYNFIWLFKDIFDKSQFFFYFSFKSIIR